MLTEFGKLCSAPNVPVTSKLGCQAAAKYLGITFRGRAPGRPHLYLFAQKGCILDEYSGVWWNPNGVDEQGDVNSFFTSSICYIS